MRPNITELVLQEDKCIGCGVCDAICPVDVLPMSIGKYGTYEPQEIDGCLDKCTLCINVCPFIDENDSELVLANTLYQQEEGSAFYEELGNVVETYVAYVSDEEKRLKSASGGIGNFILKKLLEDNIVDHILTISPTEHPDQLFRFDIIKDSDSLNRTAGSVYYPTELSEVLEYIIKNDGRYAITVLPCYAKAIRLAQQKNRLLRKRIKVLIGLVCGQMKSKYFTEELADIALNGEKADKVSYRVKNKNLSAKNYSFKFSNDTKDVKMQWSTYPSVFWTNRMFTPPACNHCTDTFAYTADLVIMDAWLPEYIDNYLGHTLLIVRNNSLKELLEKYAKNAIVLNKISPEKVYKSQEGVIKNKSYYAKNEAKGLMRLSVLLKKRVQKLSFTTPYKSLKKYIFLIKLIERVHYRLIKKVRK